MKKTLFSSLSIACLLSSGVCAANCPSYMQVDDAIRAATQLNTDAAIKAGDSVAPAGMKVSNASFSVSLTSVKEQARGNQLDCTYKIGDNTFFDVTYVAQ